MELKKNPDIDVNDSSFTRLFFQAGLTLALLATFGSFLYTTYEKQKIVQRHTFNVDEIENIEQTKQEEPPPEKQQVEQKVEVVDNQEEVDTSNTFKAQEFDPNAQVGDKPVVGKKTEKKKPKVFEIVENPAEYPGGFAAMQKFLVKMIEYPEEAKYNDVGGVVYIEMTVDQTGKVIKVEPKMPKNRQLGYGLEEEAMRVVKKMPRWKPARQASENVIQKFTIPISFELEE